MQNSPAPPDSAPLWPARLAYVTAGAAGMFCGSCLHDNTLVRAFRDVGVDALLLPTYTPIRTDERDMSVDRVFFGGVSVFLEQKFPPFRWLPRWMTRWLDHPRLLGWVTRFGMQTSAANLGALTTSMLRGARGHQHREAAQLVDWIAQHLSPDAVCFSNVLIAGCAPELRQATSAKIFVTLQGDDIFLDELPPPYRAEAEAEIRGLVPFIDAFLVHSQFYARLMSERLAIPDGKIRLAPLGIDVTGFPAPPTSEPNPAAALPTDPAKPITLGYLARLAPEKGLQQLVDAFLELRRDPRHAQVRLRLAGWLGEHRRSFVEEQFGRLRAAGLGADFEYVGEVDRAGKIAFLQSLDLLSVPTTYADPKGLFLLEALAAGVPVVQPDHGAFPELLAQTGGGVLYPAGDRDAHVAALAQLIAQPDHRRRLAQQGQATVQREFNARRMAEKTLDVLRPFATTWERSRR